MEAIKMNNTKLYEGSIFDFIKSQYCVTEEKKEKDELYLANFENNEKDVGMIVSHEGRLLTLCEFVKFQGERVTQEFLITEFPKVLLTDILNEYSIVNLNFKYIMRDVINIRTEFYFEKHDKGLRISFDIVDGALSSGSGAVGLSDFFISGNSFLCVASYDIDNENK